jgi:hypothetical protein
MKLLNKLRVMKHRERVKQQLKQAQAKIVLVDEHENMFDTIYQAQTNQLQHSNGMVAGFYSMTGDK